jgi:hypothetical protein
MKLDLAKVYKPGLKKGKDRVISKVKSTRIVRGREIYNEDKKKRTNMYIERPAIFLIFCL